ADVESGGRGPDRIISDLRAAFRMRRYPRAELPGQHLGAQANSQKRPSLPQRHRDPVDFPANKIIRIVGAHRAAEDDRAGMAIESWRKPVAETRPSDVKRVPERAQRIADAARRR